VTEATAPGGERLRAERLRIARRLDWRFLLDDPSLGDVAVGGTPDTELLAALAIHARSVRSRDVDLAVLIGRLSDEDVRAAGAGVRDGGVILAETGGLLGWRPGRPIRSANAIRRVVRQLEGAGFGSVTTYVAWPAHGRTTAFVPSAHRATVGAWLTRKVDRRLWRIVAVVARVAAGTGLLTLLAPAVVVVARRPAADGASRAPADRRGTGTSWLGARLGTPAVVALTPRFSASGHVVGLADLALAPGGGPRSVLKAARLDDDTDGIRHEAEVLRSIEPSLGAAGTAPRLVHLQVDARPPYLIETGVTGSPLDPRAVRDDVRAAALAVADLVAAMPATEAGDRPFGALVMPALEVLRRSGAGPELAALLAATERVVDPVRDVPVRVVLEHGDLAHPNLIRTPSGVLGAVDWERARPDGLPLHDLLIGLAYVVAASRRAVTPLDQATALATALTGPDSWVRDLVDAESARCGVDPALRTPLLIAPWIRSAAWLAERIEPSTWLVDRSVAHWRAMLDRSPDPA
jgi:aminoglycoside phosphotransferase (APT) family kinase protein